jgi:hypothetical protein
VSEDLTQLSPNGDAAPAPGAGADTPPAAETPPATGDDRVDAALAELSRVDDAPVSEHVAVFDDVHRRLAAALNALDGE